MQVFGKFAKGASALGSSGSESALEQLMHRVKESSSLSEKRGAIHDIKELLQNSLEARGMFGPLGGISLIAELLTEREDLELVQGALETLLVSLGDDAGEVSTESSTNCEMFVQSLDHLAVMLSLLEPGLSGIDDFYVYYYTVQILNSCLKSGLYKLQEVVSRRENGLQGLLRLLSEREAIRNEVLLILIQLTATHPGLQVLAAQGGIFERLFEIVKGEGGSEGGIIVRDSVELMTNILRDNPKSQEAFRKGQFFQPLLQLLELVDVQTLGAEALLKANQNVSHQKMDNIKLALKLTKMLVAESEDQDTDGTSFAENCVSLNQADCLPVLSQLCLNEGGVKDSEIRITALQCISSVLLLASDSRALFTKLRVFFNARPTEAVQATLTTALMAADRDEASSAVSVLVSFFTGNKAAQERVFSPIASPGSQPQSGTFIAEIMKATEKCKEGSESGKRAVQVLTCLVRDNSTVQSILVEHTVALPFGQDPNRLLYWLMEVLSHCMQFGTNLGICSALCECVMSCLDGFPVAVEYLLQIEAYVSLLLGNLHKALEESTAASSWKPSSSIFVSAIFIKALSTVIEYPKHPNSEAMSDYLKNVITASIGTENFLFLLNMLRDKTKGTSHVELHRRLMHMTPIVQTSLEPKYPAEKAALPQAMAAGSSETEKLHTSHQPQTELTRAGHTDLDNTQEELNRLREELQELRNKEEAKNKRHLELQEKIERQDTLINELRTQIGVLQSEREGLIDIKTRNEMFVCLGVEHTKVQVLAAKLMQLGYDPNALLEVEMHK